MACGCMLCLRLVALYSGSTPTLGASCAASVCICSVARRFVSSEASAAASHMHASSREVLRWRLALYDPPPGKCCAAGSRKRATVSTAPTERDQRCVYVTVWDRELRVAAQTHPCRGGARSARAWAALRADCSPTAPPSAGRRTAGCSQQSLCPYAQAFPRRRRRLQRSQSRGSPSVSSAVCIPRCRRETCPNPSAAMSPSPSSGSHLQARTVWRARAATPPRSQLQSPRDLPGAEGGRQPSWWQAFLTRAAPRATPRRAAVGGTACTGLPVSRAARGSTSTGAA